MTPQKLQEQEPQVALYLLIIVRRAKRIKEFNGHTVMRRASCVERAGGGGGGGIPPHPMSHELRLTRVSRHLPRVLWVGGLDELTSDLKLEPDTPPQLELCDCALCQPRTIHEPEPKTITRSIGIELSRT